MSDIRTTELSPEQLTEQLILMNEKCTGLKSEISERTGLSYPTTLLHLKGKGRYYKKLQTLIAAREVLRFAVSNV